MNTLRNLKKKKILKLQHYHNKLWLNIHLKNLKWLNGIKVDLKDFYEFDEIILE